MDSMDIDIDLGDEPDQGQYDNNVMVEASTQAQ